MRIVRIVHRSLEHAPRHLHLRGRPRRINKYPTDWAQALADDRRTTLRPAQPAREQRVGRSQDCVPRAIDAVLVSGYNILWLES